MEELPWLRHYGRVPAHLEYPETTLYEALAAVARRAPEAIAWDFFGRTSTYRRVREDIDRCAGALADCGLREGERILVSMPTTPQGIMAFYAANRLGAEAAMVHPLSTGAEITRYLDMTGARISLTLDAFHPVLAAATPKRPLETIIVSRIGDYLPPLARIGFWLKKGRKIRPVAPDKRVRWWRELMVREYPPAPRPSRRSDDPAAILFSGGTTGLPKAVVLSNRNFIAEGLQAASWVAFGDGDSMLAALPIFHGFGLGVCVNTVLLSGGKTILVPVFDAPTAARVIRRAKPNYIVGVPTLFDALSKHPALATADLSALKACFCGADRLPQAVRERFEQLAARRGGHVRILEGYGLTEAVSGIMATPLEGYREGSIGVPMPDMLAKICRTGTTETAPVGEEGEICLSGPAVMLGYLDDPEATAAALRVHGDGRKWLHTGDLGRMDADGFFYFTVRLKRMIKSSGFNVYPAQVEAALAEHPLVADVCVVGVPDPAQVERVKAYVVLRDRSLEKPATAEALIAHCRERLIKWSCPREVEFRASLPLTRVGKVDYRALVEEHLAKQRRDSPG
ncbi:MAG TPA: AMP-binding protein [Usitatibacter sp.]|nr:AMP-binding protein [Usitatibacter sp.]